MADSKIVKVVFEGGPAAGKTVVLNYLKDNVNADGCWDVIFVPEVAQSFISDEPDAIRYSIKNNTYVRQFFIYRTELFSEQLIVENAMRKGGNCLIIFDRGINDADVYLPADEVNLICTEKEQKEFDSHYDMVCFFLGSEDNYLNDDKTVRIENDYSAVEALGKRSYDVWHRCRNVVDFPQREDVMDKCRDVAKALNGFIGDNLFKI